MGVLGRYMKQPGERKRYQIDYSDWLDAGELVTSVTFDVFGTPTTPPLVIDDVQVLPTGLGVQYYVSGGVSGVTYKVTATMDTDQDQIKEDEVFFQIKEL